MSTTFTIDLDVSRAITAQQQLISKFEDVAKAAGGISQTIEPLKTAFDFVNTSISNVTKSSLSNLERQLREVVAAGRQLSDIKGILFSSTDFGNLKTSETTIKNIISAIQTLKSGMVGMPSFKFDTASVGQYQEKIKELQTMLQQLQYLKPQLSPVDSSNFERSVKEAISKASQELRTLTNSKDANGFLRIDTSEFDKRLDYVRNKALTVFTVISKGSIAHKDIAESMGFGDAATNHLIANMDAIAKENIRLGNVLKTSIVGDATPSNKMSSLIASATKQLESTLGPAVIRHGEIWRSMGLDVDRAGEATKNTASKAAQVATSVDASAEAYKRQTAALTEANRAQMSFYEGMTKLGNYKGETQVKQSASLPYAKTWSAAYIEPSAISGQINTLETRIAAAFQQIPIRAAESVSKTESIFSRLSSFINNIFSGRNSSTSSVSTEIANIGNAAGAAESKLSGLGLVIKRVFEYGLVYRFQNALLSIPGALWDATTAVEKLKTSYNGMFGQGGESEFKYAMDSAQKYGKSIESVADSYKKFATTAEFVGLTQDQTKKAFESVNQAMVKSGNGSEQTKGAFLALEQMLNKGVVSAEEYRRQFAQYIPGAMKMGADSVGKTTAEFMKMMKTGELISLEFIPNLMDQLAKFGEGWEKMASTIESNSERLKNGSTMLGYNLLTALVSENDIKEAQTKVINLVDFINKELQRIKPPEKEKGYLTKALGFMIDVNSTIANSAVGSAIGGAPLAAIKSGVDYLKGPETDSFAQEQYWVMWKDGVANAKAQLDDLMKTPGDISPESAKNIRMVSEQLQVGIDLVHKLCDPNWTVNVAANVDTSQITYAMGLINKLYAASKFGKTEDAAKNVKDIEAEQGKMKQLMGDLDAKMNAPDTSFRDRETLYAKKTKVQDDLAKSTVALTAATGTYLNVLKSGAKIESQSPFPTPPTNSGETKAKQIEAARKHTQDMKKEALRAYEADQGETGLKKISKAQLDENLKGWDDSLTGRIAQINKQGGGGGGHKEERHALAVDKLAQSMDNLLKKEFALADQDPLSAAFASIDEKANNLNSRVKQLALDGGVSIEKMTEDIAKFKEMARSNAVDKELEKIFPWMKKDNEIKAVFTMLGPELEKVKAHMASLGISGEETVIMLENVAKAMAKATEEAALLAKANAATNFGDYFKNASALETSKNSSGGSGEKAAIKELGDFFITTSKGMQESRIEMYKRIAEQAKTYGMDAAQAEAFVRSKMEETEVQRLENLQKYGTASEAFAARLSQNYGLYKSAETKARESSVAMADSITNATDSMASGIGQGIGDIIRNIGNGTASIEDLWKGMLSRMLDAFASFLENLITSKLKEAFGNLAGSLLSGGDSGSGFSFGDIFGGSSSKSSGSGFSFSDLFGSSSSNSGSSGVNYITTGSSNSGGSISDLISGGVSKGVTSLFSTGTTSATSSLGALASSAGVFDAASLGLGTTGLLGEATSLAGPAAGSIWTAGSSAMTSALPSVAAVVPTAATEALVAGGAAPAAAGVMGAGALSGAATMGIGLAVAAGIAGIMAMSSQEEKEPTKTASGYNVAYKSGHAAAYGVDFYSDGSVQSTGASDPDIQKKIADSFKDTAENLSDFAEELGFVIDVLDTFEFPNMNITDDQLDGYIRNGENQMAFQGLMNAGLRGAFDAVLEDGEIYVDAIERLATAYKSVVGSFEGYGYAMEDVAQISQEQIDALRMKNTEVAEGTAQALATMAAAMGAASDFVSQVASDTSIATAALSVTDEQLQNILEADYSSKLLDAVGGEDAFKSIMGNLTENIFDTVEAYAANIGYYNEKAQAAIAKIGDSSITSIDVFWEKFDEAVKGGLTVDEFEAWGKASEWVNQIDTVIEALEDFNNAMNNLEGSLDSRKAKALGMSDQASYITLLYNAENELYEARKNNYDEAIIAKIQEVQELEKARALYEIAKKSAQKTQDLNVREMEVTGNPYASIYQAYYDNGWELQEAMESGLYTEADIARLAEVQRKEIEKLWEELADAIEEAAQGAHSRMLKAGGKTDEAAMYDFQISAAKELEDALESGLYSAESYSELMRSIALEAKNLEKTQARERKTSFVEAFISGPLELEQQKNSYALTVLQDQISVAEAVKVLLDGTYQSIESAYNTMNSLATSLRSTLQGFRWNSGLSRNTATQTFTEQSSYYAELLGKVNSTDKTDMDYSKNIGELQNFAGTYLEAAKSYFGASSEYWKIYDDVTGKLGELQINTQTDSDIYREQLLAQKSLVNNSQLQIDALTLANTKISEQLSALSLMQATDDLAYKQEAVAQNMTQAQLAGVIASLNGNGSAIAAMAAGAYANVAAQIANQQAIYAAEASLTNVQIGELDLQTQLSKLAIQNQEYQTQILNANKSLLEEGVYNDTMQEALLKILAKYAEYQSSLAGNSLTNTATTNWYLSEIMRIDHATYEMTANVSGWSQGVYTWTQGIHNYSAAIYSVLNTMNGKMTSGSSSSSYLGGYATGGEVTGPGWFMAGENGPEPVFLSGGSASVTSNDDFTGSMDTNTKVTAAGLSALLSEMRAMRKELSQIRSKGQLMNATPARN